MTIYLQYIRHPHVVPPSTRRRVSPCPCAITITFHSAIIVHAVIIAIIIVMRNAIIVEVIVVVVVVVVVVVFVVVVSVRLVDTVLRRGNM